MRSASPPRRPATGLASLLPTLLLVAALGTTGGSLSAGRDVPPVVDITVTGG